mmetsp:Transcript_172728/g.553654  ORF Transcript_172728/g.553654 Transcript_172728/m.553654 type:complete len:200 (+) Transcript_172728:949-1548(+)
MLVDGVHRPAARSQAAGGGRASQRCGGRGFWLHAVHAEGAESRQHTGGPAGLECAVTAGRRPGEHLGPPGPSVRPRCLHPAAASRPSGSHCGACGQGGGGLALPSAPTSTHRLASSAHTNLVCVVRGASLQSEQSIAAAHPPRGRGICAQGSQPPTHGPWRAWTGAGLGMARVLAGIAAICGASGPRCGPAETAHGGDP